MCLSAPSPVNLALFVRTRNILDDFREAYYWLRQNTDEHARVMSWWDYGYQIAGMANRTTLVDNNTWNNSHIALVSFILRREMIHAHFSFFCFFLIATLYKKIFRTSHII